MTIESVLLVSGALFAIGAYGAVSRRSLITVIMSLELMFNGVVIAAVGFS
jgi:NADH:ubiquinone oxidoreductase subunit K